MAEKRLTREQARELYDDLHKAMTQMMHKRGEKPPAIAASGSSAPNSKLAKEIADALKSGLNGKTIPAPTPRPTRSAEAARRTTSRPVAAIRSGSTNGQAMAVLFVAVFCCAKVALSALEASGIAQVEPVQATVVAPAPVGPQWSKEEVKILTSLDHRRAELEDRSARVEQREMELNARDRDLAGRLTELRELTERLKIEREKGEKQHNGQLDQLANVYGSMNPPEAAHLLEQLDVQVALSLIQRMPEKRIGQILSLMNAQRALELTNLLTKQSVQ
jgi:flagellar motility protein MotE (MotC chaperone)